MTEPLLVGVREAAAIVGVGRNQAYAWVRDGTWPSVACGRKRLIPRAALIRFVEEASRSDEGEGLERGH